MVDTAPAGSRPHWVVDFDFVQRLVFRGVTRDVSTPLLPDLNFQGLFPPFETRPILAAQRFQSKPFFRRVRGLPHTRLRGSAMREARASGLSRRTLAICAY